MTRFNLKEFWYIKTGVSVTRNPCCRRETARCQCNFVRWRPVVILDLIEPKIAPNSIRRPWKNYPRLNMKWIGSSNAEIWPFEIRNITRVHLGPHYEERRGCMGSPIVPLERAMAISYTLSIVTIALSRNIRSQFANRVSAMHNSTGAGGRSLYVKILGQIPFGVCPWCWGMQSVNIPG